MLKITKYEVTLELVEPMLGTVPKNREVYTRHVQAKSREAIEKAATKGVPLTNGEEANPESINALLEPEEFSIKECEEKGWTGFMTDEEGPFIFDYALKGFLKESARTLKEWGGDSEDGTEDGAEDGPGEGEDGAEGEPEPKGKGKSKAKAKKPTHGLVVKQLQDKVSRFVFVRPRKIRLAKVEGALERPLRAMTPQGPRVTVVRSDTVQAGQRLSFTLSVLKGGQVSESMLRDIFEYGEYQGLGQWRSGGYGRFIVISMKRL